MGPRYFDVYYPVEVRLYNTIPHIYDIRYTIGTFDWFVYSFIIEASPPLSHTYIYQQGTSVF